MDIQQTKKLISMKIKIICFIFICLLWTILNNIIAHPPNDKCTSAISLNSGSSLCNQNSTNATLQTNECYVNFTGATQTSMWYYFNATSSSMVLNFMQTNVSNKLRSVLYCIGSVYIR